MTDDTAEPRAGNSRLQVGNPAKPLFEDPAVTKLELASYYRAVAPVMLPHIRGRPVALQRFPDGIGAEGFFQKQVPTGAPDWLARVNVPRERGGNVTMVRCEDAASLIYLADQAAITFHPWLTTVDDLRCPDRMIFDLDPQDDDFDVVRCAALALRALLDEIQLPSFVMTTGSRGLHVTVPLQRNDDIDDVRDFARRTADLLSRRHPGQLTTEVRKENKSGRLFVDVLRNAYGQHAVAPYSVRAIPGAPVATPLKWTEVEDRRLTPQRWRLHHMEDRLADDGNPWQGARRRAHSLGPARKRLAHVLD